jgi:hypothetical protein
MDGRKRERESVGVFVCLRSLLTSKVSDIFQQAQKREAVRYFGGTHNHKLKISVQYVHSNFHTYPLMHTCPHVYAHTNIDTQTHQKQTWGLTARTMSSVVTLSRPRLLMTSASYARACKGKQAQVHAHQHTLCVWPKYNGVTTVVRGA